MNFLTNFMEGIKNENFNDENFNDGSNDFSFGKLRYSKLYPGCGKDFSDKAVD